MNKHSVENICGKQLSEVAFVMDYVQFGFDGPVLTAYSNPIADTLQTRNHFPAAGSRDALCSFIGHVVNSVDFQKGIRLTIQFDNGRIEIPLDSNSRVVGSAVEFWIERGGPPMDY